MALQSIVFQKELFATILKWLKLCNYIVSIVILSENVQ